MRISSDHISRTYFIWILIIVQTSWLTAVVAAAVSTSWLYFLLSKEHQRIFQLHWPPNQWKRMVTKATFVGPGFTRKPPKYERFLRPTDLRFTKANVTHPELKCTFNLDIIGIKNGHHKGNYHWGNFQHPSHWFFFFFLSKVIRSGNILQIICPKT